VVFEDTKAGQWKAQRPFRFDCALTPVSPAAASDVEDGCTICGDTPPTDMVSLVCGQHRFCRHCVTEWFNANGLADAHCPLCRHKAVANPESVRELIFGVFHADPRYNASENFERSCAILDEQLADNSKASVEWSAETLFDAWDILVAGATLESAESSLFHCQAVKVPEFARINGEIMAACSTLVVSRKHPRIAHWQVARC